MQLIEFLDAEPAAFVAVIGVLGLIIGSFLNVVIHRLPQMLERQWREQCREFLGTVEDGPLAEPFNLVRPGSRCPHCGHRIRAIENVPIVSYLVLGGRCSQCKQKISPRYPLIEGVTGILSALVAWHFGFTAETVAALALTWALVALSVIDFDHQLLPDSITLPILWLGLVLSIPAVFVGPTTSIVGAVAGYLALWAVFQLFKLLTGKEGMGYGDFKLLALLGAWMGWQMLTLIIILSSVVGAAVGIALVLFRGRDRNVPIPYGPYLAAAGWIALLWGEPIIDTYLRATGVPV